MTEEEWDHLDKQAASFARWKAKNGAALLEMQKAMQEADQRPSEEIIRKQRAEWPDRQK